MNTSRQRKPERAASERVAPERVAPERAADDGRWLTHTVWREARVGRPGGAVEIMPLMMAISIDRSATMRRLAIWARGPDPARNQVWDRAALLVEAEVNGAGKDGPRLTPLLSLVEPTTEAIIRAVLATELDHPAVARLAWDAVDCRLAREAAERRGVALTDASGAAA